MIWDGSVRCLDEVRKLHPSAVIYAMQTKLPDGSYVFDSLYGMPVLCIEDRTEQPGRVFEIGMEVV
jgi:hypothetical protein